jgi:hypothetical protein
LGLLTRFADATFLRFARFLRLGVFALMRFADATFLRFARFLRLGVFALMRLVATAPRQESALERLDEKRADSDGCRPPSIHRPH